MEHCCVRPATKRCHKMAAAASAKRRFALVVCVCLCCELRVVSCGSEQFVDPIFEKYGANGIMSLQGFELLVYNLGLGRETTVVAPNGTSPRTTTGEGEGEVEGARNNKHRENRDQRKGMDLTTDGCLTPTEIVLLTSGRPASDVVEITPKIYLDLCPALVYQLDHRSCSPDKTRNLKYMDNTTTKPKDEGSSSNWHLAWVYATLSVLLISLSGLIGIAVVPFARSAAYPQLLRFLVALAVGTLCGDALLHLLPHSLTPHDHTHAHAHAKEETHNHNLPMFKCGVTFLTVLLFYTLESVLPIFNKGMHHTHHHGHTHELKPEMGSMLTGQEHIHRATYSPIALMVVLGDGLHNLTDGLAIGAAFASDPVTGLATAIAVLCHELPHELGDFAVLLRAGLSVKRVLVLNMVASFLSFLGMGIGLVLANGHAEASQWIYAATAGSFLYIALADLVPEMGHGADKHIGNVLLQVTGIALGGVIMLVIALHEDSLRSLFA